MAIEAFVALMVLPFALQSVPYFFSSASDLTAG